jgi:hypothetical protein
VRFIFSGVHLWLKSVLLFYYHSVSPLALEVAGGKMAYQAMMQTAHLQNANIKWVEIETLLAIVCEVKAFDRNRVSTQFVDVYLLK